MDYSLDLQKLTESITVTIAFVANKLLSMLKSVKWISEPETVPLWANSWTDAEKGVL